ncbi:hypothetical protein BT69DRAFT_1068576 [Atractiella rhizophila]|nr:hypothetical protein BT69DRAFT_1068576 [Atractiella rhizophila]
MSRFSLLNNSLLASKVTQTHPPPYFSPPLLVSHAQGRQERTEQKRAHFGDRIWNSASYHPVVNCGSPGSIGRSVKDGPISGTAEGGG